ncbi:TIGR03862 family flavoprotein [Chitinimonas arctica]|uniref:TIGR03862 family flavoprotein n=1 Tax=Chitinimonas arctica TaxID=2594795 RepID=A0A516SG54_9NEIS|nr:TIGR03862 family flavoprotein [Chitinimonas arctica]QDQ27147.1 TIGR03862 family flavoprotein [Chitinimonas arctica]
MNTGTQPPAFVAIIGAGPAGLMAAEVLAQAGARVAVYDAMPSVGRKFLLAGVGGMNITHSEALEPFLSRYGERRDAIAPLLAAFSPTELREWIHGLGIATFVGSSGRVFPTDMKAAPLLRAWLQRLRGAGVQLHVRHRWLGWDADGALRFASEAGEQAVKADAVVLALGGASWPRLGSDGSWLPLLAERGVSIAPLQAANCGFEVNWSAHLCEKFAGSPLKNVVLSFTDAAGELHRKQGEFVVSEAGVEGSLIYAFSARLRQAIAQAGSATIHVDLTPGKDTARLIGELDHPRGSRSMSSHLQSRVGLGGVKAALLWECVSKDDFADPARLAAAIKALPIQLQAARPVAEAISTAGGVRFEALTDGLMLSALPGVFCAGEMLDWEAPTGGYLLTACFASGRKAGQGVLAWLGNDNT